MSVGLGTGRAMWEQQPDAIHTKAAPGRGERRSPQMTSNTRPPNHTLGTLRSIDGKGVVRIEDRYDTDIDDLWEAVTDPARLRRWYGVVEGDLRLGGEFRLSGDTEST